MIPYGKQHITQEDIDEVVLALKADYLTQGPKIKEFENAFADYIGCKYAVAVANGTGALHLCALALNVGPGQKVITTPITFAASANCIQYCGGEVVFADVDPETHLLDIKQVEEILNSSPKGTYTGIIPVDFAGLAVDLEAFRQLADLYDLWIIEDACHAPGGYFSDSSGNRQRCGNGAYADLAIFSFHPVKHIACGEGGMITTNSTELYEKLLALRTHGIVRSSELYENTVEFAGGENSVYPGWYMEMQMLGFNYRLTDFQAALGLSQLHRAEQSLAIRREIAKRYHMFFANKKYVKRSTVTQIDGHAYHLFILEVHDRLGLYNALRDQGIYAQVHYIPCHLMPYYRKLGWKENDFPVAEQYYTQCISLPLFPTLTAEEQQNVMTSVDKFYNG